MVTRILGRKPLLGELLDESHWARDSLVGHWIMNEGSGNKIYDMSRYGNHGDFVNTNWAIDRVLDFDGDDAVHGTTPIGLDYPLTLSVWVYVRTHVNFTRFFGVSNSAGVTNTIAIGNGSGRWLAAAESDNQFYSIFILNTWQLLTGVFISASDVTAYVNGQITTEEGASSNLLQGNIPDGKWSIGARWDTSFVDALISDARLYNRGLIQPEVHELYWNPYPEYGTRMIYAPVVGVTVPDDTLAATVQMANSGGMIGAVNV